MTSFPGMLAAPWLIGIVESITSTFYGPSWAPAVAFGFLLLTLAVRPAKFHCDVRGAGWIGRLDHMASDGMGFRMSRFPCRPPSRHKSQTMPSENQLKVA